MLQKFVNRQSNVFGNLTQKNRRNVSAWMNGHGCVPAVLMAKLLVGTTLTNLDETKRFEDGNDLSRLQDGNSSHVQGTVTVWMPTN